MPDANTMTISTEMLIALFAVGAQVLAFVGAVLKGQAWAERQALRALSSERGREIVMRMVRDQIDLKFDTMATTLEGLTKTIEQMGAKIERRLDKLDTDMQGINVRVALLEQQKRKD